MECTHPIKAYRDRCGVSQEHLAKQIGASRVAITRWESGARMPGKKYLPKLVAVTGIPLRELRPDIAELMREVA